MHFRVVDDSFMLKIVALDHNWIITSVPLDHTWTITSGTSGTISKLDHNVIHAYDKLVVKLVAMDRAGSELSGWCFELHDMMKPRRKHKLCMFCNNNHGQGDRACDSAPYMGVNSAVMV